MDDAPATRPESTPAQTDPLLDMIER
jgi:hypothetical protein